MIRFNACLRDLRSNLSHAKYGERGILLTHESFSDILKILKKFEKLVDLNVKAKNSIDMTIEQFAEEIDVKKETMLRYCSNYRFASFIYNERLSTRSKICVNKEFVENMYEFLQIREKFKTAEALKKWWNADRRKERK